VLHRADWLSARASLAGGVLQLHNTACNGQTVTPHLFVWEKTLAPGLAEQ